MQSLFKEQRQNLERGGGGVERYLAGKQQARSRERFYRLLKLKGKVYRVFPSQQSPEQFHSFLLTFPDLCWECFLQVEHLLCFHLRDPFV